MRDIFEDIKQHRLELTRRRAKYVHDIEVLRFKYNDISKKVEQIGKPYLDKYTGEIILPKYDPKKPPPRIARLLVRMKKQKQILLKKNFLDFKSLQVIIILVGLVHLENF